MATLRDITGSRFGLIVAIKPASSDRHGWHWECQCDCGNRVTVRSAKLLSGRYKSCGCDRAPKPETWMRNDATFRSWSAMMQRCFNPKSTNFKYWGGRGITVCERWKTFENFRADMGERPPGRSLDRI